MTLLLDRCGFRIALSHEDAAEIRAILARHVLPGRLALVITETDSAIRLGRIQKNAPAIVGHLHVVEMRPAAGLNAHRGAQIDLERTGSFRTHVLPPAQELRLPMLQCTLQGSVL